jgi:hypothetical protein
VDVEGCGSGFEPEADAEVEVEVTGQVEEAEGLNER